MPNGGGDNCGTCWFNAQNEGQEGHYFAGNPNPSICQIRNLAIRNPFYTYCANHPYRNPGRVELPIGPVWEMSGHYRVIWRLSPDAEEIRLALLAFLGRIEEKFQPEYLSGATIEDTVIWQLGEFREQRAVNDLRRIAEFSPKKEYEIGPFY